MGGHKVSNEGSTHKILLHTEALAVTVNERLLPSQPALTYHLPLLVSHLC